MDKDTTSTVEMAAASSHEGAQTLKLLEVLQTDLKTLCLHAKKRFPHIREVSHTVQILVSRIHITLIVLSNFQHDVNKVVRLKV